MAHTFIDTPKALSSFLDGLPLCNYELPDLFIDLESNDLSRHGTLSLVTIRVKAKNEIGLVDVTVLGEKAFSTPARDGRTLKAILESDSIKKVFFDIRHDSDALFGLFGIRVKGIEDLQLMELATRTSGRQCLCGLAKCISQSFDIPAAMRWQCWNIKRRGRGLFDPDKGGSFAVFDHRPLSKEIID